MTKTQWAKLTDKQQWDIIVALRGPDSNYGETLKWFTTSVIRGQMAPVMRVGGTVNKDLKLVVLPIGSHSKPSIQTAFSGSEAWNYGHFVEHIQEAAYNLGLEVLYLFSDDWHRIMRGRSIIEAMKEILETAPKVKTYDNSQQTLLAELKRHLDDCGSRL